jgi:hypothetical protein
LVWDFGGRLFDLFLEPFLGAKKSPFFNPQSSTKPTGKLPANTLRPQLMRVFLPGSNAISTGIQIKGEKKQRLNANETVFKQPAF